MMRDYCYELLLSVNNPDGGLSELFVWVLMLCFIDLSECVKIFKHDLEAVLHMVQGVLCTQAQCC